MYQHSRSVLLVVVMYWVVTQLDVFTGATPIDILVGFLIGSIIADTAVCLGTWAHRRRHDDDV